MCLVVFWISNHPWILGERLIWSPFYRTNSPSFSLSGFGSYDHYNQVMVAPIPDLKFCYLGDKSPKTLNGKFHKQFIIYSGLCVQYLEPNRRSHAHEASALLLNYTFSLQSLFLNCTPLCIGLMNSHTEDINHPFVQCIYTVYTTRPSLSRHLYIKCWRTTLPMVLFFLEF